jgi:catechol 2,3-dioxygenase-like lactoylglutathione lyase family enzyme
MSGPPLHHVGIVFPDEESATRMMELLGLEEDYRGFVEKWSALCVFTKPNGATPIEFIIPNGGPLAKFNKGAGGLHHVAVTVVDLEAVAQRLAARGIELLEREHVKGAGNFICNFLSPAYTRGIIVEFIQEIA